MNALDLLIADHNRLRGQFSLVKDKQETDADDLEAAVEKMLTELDVHTAIEEEIFYPAIKDTAEEIADMVAEGLEEHKVAKELAAEIRAMDSSEEQWTAKVKVIIESVEHHTGEEESDMFPKVRTALQADALNELGEALDARKGELGLPTLADRADLNLDELHQLATEQAIPGRSSMKADELAATVNPS